jgi:hypothetical protein
MKEKAWEAGGFAPDNLPDAVGKVKAILFI